MKCSFFIFSITLLLISFSVYSQVDFRPGYIVTQKYDTIYGHIDYRGDLIMSKTCTFKSSDNSEPESYSPNEIIAYSFPDGKLFVSKEIKGEKYFLEYLIKGKLNIYYLRTKEDDMYFFEKSDVPLTLIPYEEMIRHKKNKKYLYQSKTHVNVLRHHLSDAKKLENKIAEIEKPEHKNLIKLAENYHHEVCEGEKCIVYNKKKPFFAVKPELVLGSVRFKNKYYLNDNGYFFQGIMLNLWIPRANEKLYIRTGIIRAPSIIVKTYYDLTYKSEETTFLKIPLQFQYKYPKGLIRPTLAYGPNLYHQFQYSVTFVPGLSIHLSDMISLALYYEAEFESEGFFPKKVISDSIYGGLIFSFD